MCSFLEQKHSVYYYEGFASRSWVAGVRGQVPQLREGIGNGHKPQAKANMQLPCENKTGT